MMIPAEYKKLQTRCDELAVEFFEDVDHYFRKLASLGAQKAVIAQLITLKQIEPFCDECGHAVLSHFDPYGCQYERGDDYVNGLLQAMGPCGCKSWTVKEVEVSDETTD